MRSLIPCHVIAVTFLCAMAGECEAQQIIRRRPPMDSPAKIAYRLDAGDFLAVVVDGVVGRLHEAKTHIPKPGDGTLPAIGTPVPVLKDRTLGLPMIDPVDVRGMTVQEAKTAIKSAYEDAEMIARDNVVMVSLLRKRTIDVTVLHSRPERTYVDNVRLEEATASPLAALANSARFDPRGKVSVVGRYAVAQLKNDDVVLIESDRPGFFFAGGNLTPGQYSLPADRTVSVLQAVSIAGGTRNSRPLDRLNVTISSPSRSTVTVPYRWLLKNPSAHSIRRGDTIILR